MATATTQSKSQATPSMTSSPQTSLLYLTISTRISPQLNATVFYSIFLVPDDLRQAVYFGLQYVFLVCRHSGPGNTSGDHAENFLIEGEE